MKLIRGVARASGAVASGDARSECDEAARGQGADAKPARKDLPEALAIRRGREPIARPSYIAAYNALLILTGISSRFRSFWNLRPNRIENPHARNARQFAIAAKPKSPHAKKFYHEDTSHASAYERR